MRLFYNHSYRILLGFGIGIGFGYVLGRHEISKKNERNKMKFFKLEKIIQNYKDFVDKKGLKNEFIEFSRNNLN